MLSTEDIKAVNAEARANDESHLWPIRGRFNVTERAIRRVRRAMAEGLCVDDKLSYELTLDAEISEIVNNSDNW